MKKALFATMIVMATASAFAGNDRDGDTNNYDNRNYGGNTNNAGGNGYGGQGGSVNSSGNSANSNKNDNRNNNSNLNAQGQKQGQSQGQGQSQTSKSNAQQGQAQSTENANNSKQNVNVEGDKYEAARIPVATAYAAGLTATNGTCFGSASVGLQFAGFGASGGSTTFDENCDVRYDAIALREAGQPKAAIARLCQKPAMAQAMEDAGTPCKSAKVSAATSASSMQTASATKYEYTDPIIRARLGLPPLK